MMYRLKKCSFQFELKRSRNMPNRNQYWGLIDSIVAETHRNADLILRIYFCHKITRNLNRILFFCPLKQTLLQLTENTPPAVLCKTPVLYLNIRSGVGVLLPWRLTLRWNQCSGVSGFWRRVATSQTGRLMGTGEACYRLGKGSCCVHAISLSSAANQPPSEQQRRLPLRWFTA